jgi:hypothetical protein
MHVLPGMSYTELKEMNWRQLSGWRIAAIDLFKNTHGVTDV